MDHENKNFKEKNVVQRVLGRSWVLPPERGLDMEFLAKSHRTHTENQKEDRAGAQTLREAQNILGEPTVNPSYRSGPESRPGAKHRQELSGR